MFLQAFSTRSFNCTRNPSPLKKIIIPRPNICHLRLDRRLLNDGIAAVHFVTRNLWRVLCSRVWTKQNSSLSIYELTLNILVTDCDTLKCRHAHLTLAHSSTLIFVFDTVNSIWPIKLQLPNCDTYPWKPLVLDIMSTLLHEIYLLLSTRSGTLTQRNNYLQPVFSLWANYGAASPDFGVGENLCS